MSRGTIPYNQKCVSNLFTTKTIPKIFVFNEKDFTH